MKAKGKLISIITISFNNKEGLKKTIESVLPIKDNDIEFLVIDGGSTDGTKELLNNYSENIDFLVSEKDYGISDAFNKGVFNSNGKWLFFLNSGDTFSTKTSITKIKTDLFANQHKFLCFYKVELSNGKATMPTKEMIEKKGIDYIVNKAEIPHQGTFISKHLFTKYGMFSTSLKVRMDYDFFLRIRKESSNFIFIDNIIANYEVGGISNQVENFDKFIMEGIISKIQNKVKLNLKDLYYIFYFLFLRRKKYAFA